MNRYTQGGSHRARPSSDLIMVKQMVCCYRVASNSSVFTLTSLPLEARYWPIDKRFHYDFLQGNRFKFTWFFSHRR